jgi:hypothetical protein
LLEARFALRYQFWSWEDGAEKCIDEHTGSYTQIVDALLGQGLQAALECPLVSREQALAWVEREKKELKEEFGEELDQEEVADILKLNPNCH